MICSLSDDLITISLQHSASRGSLAPERIPAPLTLTSLHLADTQDLWRLTLEYLVSLKLGSLIPQYGGLLIDLHCHVSCGSLLTKIFPKTILEYFYNNNPYDSHDIIDVCVCHDSFPTYVSKRSSSDISQYQTITIIIWHCDNCQIVKFKYFKVDETFS